MKTLARYAHFAVISLALPAAAQPVVNAIVNNYSYIPSGLPSYGIAQGSIFVIFGTGLAPAASPLQSTPLKTTLNGVSVQFNVQGASTQALLYYVSPTQVAGILPSATPTGSGTVTVTSGAQTSAAAPLTVVQSAVGFLSNGLFGVATDGSHQVEPNFYAANPGETLVLYGTGAGPVSGDESIPQTPQNLSNIPLEIDIGGVSANITYHGRSIYPGLDQFNVVVPSGVSGCNVSLYARSGNYVSNVVLLSIAASGRTCTDQLSGSASLLTAGTGGTVTLGNLSINSNTFFTPSGNTYIPATTDAGYASFRNQTLPAGSSESSSIGVPFPSIGNCLVTGYVLPNPLPTGQPNPPLPGADAGPVINFTGPNGLASVPPEAGATGQYGGPLSLITGKPFIPANGGTFTIDNGSGGTRVGAFKQQVNVPPPLTWTNIGSVEPTINRSQPLVIQWTGGDPGSYVMITGSSQFTTPTQIIGAGFQCTALDSAGQLTVPSAILMALPAQEQQYSTTGRPSFYLSTVTGSTFTAPGVGGGLVGVQSSVGLAASLQ